MYLARPGWASFGVIEAAPSCCSLAVRVTGILPSCDMRSLVRKTIRLFPPLDSERRFCRLLFGLLFCLPFSLRDAFSSEKYSHGELFVVVGPNFTYCLIRGSYADNLLRLFLKMTLRVQPHFLFNDGIKQLEKMA